MFQRRNPQSLLQRTREFLWPSMGWKRSFVYIKHRLVRLSDSSHKIAMGLAIGTSVSFTPLVGTHFIQAALLCYLVRGNMLAAIIGTFAGNPWTFPFMWWASINFGGFLFSLLGLPAKTQLPENFDIGVFFTLLFEDPLRVMLPWTLGGYLICLLCMPIAYLVFYRLVSGAKAARGKARLRRLKRVSREVTGMR